MRPANEFFTRLEAVGNDLTTWVGELYFELHRGTYTTQADNKKYNRLSEFLLHEVEFLSATAAVLKGYPYPKTELDRLWKMVLTNQFHDIIPGSSIDLVYQDSDRDYEEILSTGKALREHAASALLGKAATNARNVLAINTTSVSRREVIELPAGCPGAQTSADGTSLGVASAPAYGYAIFKPETTTSQQVFVEEKGDLITLENEFVRAVLKKDGSLASLYDKRNHREAIETGKSGNRLVIFDDHPTNWDAWDVDIFHLEKIAAVLRAKSCRIVEYGPLRAGVSFEYQISSNSTLSQTVYLTAISPRLDFHTDVEWHEKHKFLKTEFPLRIRAMQATYEIQFGHLQRPTHFNTSWDFARFEVPAHHWGDLSDNDFGVALLNDCKYGYAAHGNILRLSLLRAPTAPDPHADQGHHSFRYALMPHAGSPQGNGVIEEGYRFNQPLLVAPTMNSESQLSYFNVSNPAIILDTVKKAEDTDDLVIRLYEARGTHGTAQLNTCAPAVNIQRCNLLEEEIDEPGDQQTENGVRFNFRPFEIVSFRMTIKKYL